MANPNPNPSTRFKPGKSGNPTGATKLYPTPEEVKHVRALTREDLVEIGMMAFKGDVPSLQRVVANMTHSDPAMRPTAIQVLVASVLLKAIKEGNSTVLESLINRFFGKTPIALLVVNQEKPMGPKDADTIKAESRRLLEDMSSDD